MENNMKKKQKAKGIRAILTRSLRLQILLPFLTLIVLTGIVVAVVSFYSSVNQTTKALAENTEKQIESLNDTFEMFFSNVNHTMERLTSSPTILTYDGENRLDVIQYLSETQENSTSIANIYATLEDTGEVIIYPEVDLGDAFNAKERNWYVNAVESGGETVWSDPYTDESTGETVVTVSKAYYNGDELMGVIGADILVGTLMSMVGNLEIGESGYGVILDQSGKFLAHPDPNIVGQDESKSENYQKLKETGDQGIVEYEDQGEDKIIAFIKNPTTGWIIGGMVFVEDFEKQARTIILPIAITLIIVIFVATAVSLFVARGITKPVHQVMERMQHIARGNLNEKPLEVNLNNEISQLVNATNSMNNNMRDVLKEINGVSETVTSQSEELTHAATEVNKGTEQIASTMEELAAGSETQANHATELASIMGSFSEQVEAANESGKQIYDSSEKVMEMATKGNELMESSTKQMQKIDQMVEETVQKMENLDDQSKEISKLVTVIKEVSDQTNLLALNAAIEAARAGEHGKGFSVVADEVRKLAEQVAISVNDITGFVSNIQNESDTVAKSLRDGYVEIEQGTAQLGTTSETFEEIGQAIQEMAERAQVISKALTDISVNSKQMNTSIEEIASVSEESAAGIEQTAASVQQTSSSMEEVAASSDDLAKLAEQLNELVRRFKL